MRVFRLLKAFFSESRDEAVAYLCITTALAGLTWWAWPNTWLITIACVVWFMWLRIPYYEFKSWNTYYGDMVK